MSLERSASRGGDQEMFFEDGAIDYTPRPADLEGVRAAYAIYMVGDSMEPRYEPGWLLHVNPFKPATRGRDVVVYKKNQAVLMKQFVGWRATRLRCASSIPKRPSASRAPASASATSSSAPTKRVEPGSAGVSPASRASARRRRWRSSPTVPRQPTI
jgi:hypothetical protein